MHLIHIFGATSLSAEALRQKIKINKKHFNTINYSRKEFNYENINLEEPIITLNPIKFKKSSIVSFAPIWIFSEFLINFAKQYPDCFKEINSIILCSSSSVQTKRFAFNKFDKNLSKNLLIAEDKIMDLSKSFNIPCIILRPTMIYGSLEKYKDENINKLIRIMQFSPLLILPKNSGYRQPIHAYQLAEIIVKYIEIFSKNKDQMLSQKILIGGDLEFSYLTMIKLIKQNLPKKDRAKKCKLIVIPDLIFVIFSFLFCLKSLKSFESVLRVFADLSGFKRSYEILGSSKRKFPIKPFF